MRRIVNSLLTVALVLVPALALSSSAATPAVTANGAHYVAASLIQPNSACAPGDPGTL